MYTYAYTYIHTWIHIHTHTHIHVHIHIYIYICLYTHIYNYLYIYRIYTSCRESEANVYVDVHNICLTYTPAHAWCATTPVNACRLFVKKCIWTQHLSNIHTCTCMVRNNTCKCMPTLCEKMHMFLIRNDPKIGHGLTVPVAQADWHRLCLCQWDKHNLSQWDKHIGTGCVCSTGTSRLAVPNLFHWV